MSRTDLSLLFTGSKDHNLEARVFLCVVKVDITTKRSLQIDVLANCLRSETSLRLRFESPLRETERESETSIAPNSYLNFRVSEIPPQ